jgi:hypothetical protein
MIEVPEKYALEVASRQLVYRELRGAIRHSFTQSVVCEGHSDRAETQEFQKASLRTFDAD